MLLKIAGTQPKPFTALLAGDVGATKTDLAIFDWTENGLQTRKEGSCKTKAYPDISALLHDFVANEKMPAGICLGVAGPVQGGRADLTNLGWQVEQEALSRQFNQAPVRLVNDLEATAYGLALLDEQDVFVIHEGDRFPTGNAAIIAPGTGLGEAGLFFDGEGYHPFASEGGHVDFVPRTDIDLEIFSFLKKKFGHVSQERVLSGPGICVLYDFLRQKKDREEPAWLKEKLLAHDKATVISQNATECEICRETMELFLRYLAVESANLVLKLKATGGLFIAGGIVPHLLSFLDKDIFLKWFRNAGRLKGLLQQVPVKVLVAKKTALLGAAFYGFRHSS
ncbi:glucokinase [Flavisolibacter nicotianae]|uniref:glucokinase n=1 Tax=Flavisolibacter nicotianae TaxID=2364882 RepID=UPI000EB3CD57|nr:glucokinase [Flavisolibacter nicotianae]